MAARILVVEDEPAIQELIAVNLSRAGHVVQRTGSAEGAKGFLNASLPDLVVLDWMLPGMSGLEFLRTLRAEERTRGISLILLSARVHERDMVAGLESGADDYVTKPFSVRELLARVAAVLRRRVPQVSDDTVVAGTLQLEPVGPRVVSGGCELSLGPTEFRLLHFLMTHADRVHSRAELLDSVWGDHFLGDERTVDVHIRRLRSALQKGGNDACIQTVRGYGYSFSVNSA
jgi:two-component system phosphate regulon response regulator PhoB